MRNTVAGVDRFGNFLLSSQVYTNARDLARLGLLYLNRGKWNGEQILSQNWIQFARTPAPATSGSGNSYGGHFWLVPDDRTDLPQDAYATSGARGQYTIIVPSHDLIIVRRGLDERNGRRPGFSQWNLLGEVLKAFPQGPGGTKAGERTAR
jgi:CubicO group peptidase (beta-lactamase class C family)